MEVVVEVEARNVAADVEARCGEGEKPLVGLGGDEGADLGESAEGVHVEIEWSCLSHPGWARL